jgi:polysaccharide pyruvyl transferase WcaK-like protein
MKRFSLLANTDADTTKYHLGDQAMLQFMIKRLTTMYPDAAFAVFSRGPKFIEKNYGVTAYPSADDAKLHEILTLLFSKRLFNWLFPKYSTLSKQLKGYDCFFVCGGGNFNDLFSREVKNELLMILLACKLNVKVIVSSQTIGPFMFSRRRIRCWLRHFLLRCVLNKTEVITVRDPEVSAKNLSLLRITKPQIFVCGDDAIFLECKQDDDIDNLLEPLKDNLKVGFSLHFWGTQSLVFRQNIAHLFDQLIEEKNAKLFYIENWDDLEYAKIIFSLMNHGDEIIILNGITDAEKVKHLISKMDLMISTRYHSLVLALSCNVPSISVTSDDYYTQKNEGLMSLYNLENNVNKQNFDIAEVMGMINRKEEIKNILKSKNEELFCQEHCFRHFIRRIVEGSTDH